MSNRQKNTPVKQEPKAVAAAAAAVIMQNKPKMTKMITSTYRIKK